MCPWLRNRNKTSAHKKRNEAKRLMNLHNHNDDIIGYRDPIGSSVRRRRRYLTSALYNDRSPEVLAMNARFRASAYTSRATTDVDLSGGATATRSGSFLNLMRQYDNQARDNFSKEAALFAIITAIAVVWPVVHTLSAILR